MNARLSRELADEVQVRALAEREEKRRARQIAHDELLEEQRTSLFLAVVGVVLVLAGFTAGIGVIVCLAVAWNRTGDDRFGWLALLFIAAVTVGYAYSFRKHPDGVGR